MLPSSSQLGTSPEELAFLQRRVMRFGRGVAMLGLTFLAFRAVIALSFWQLNFLIHPSFVLHLVGSLAPLATSLVLRGTPRSARFIYVAEAAGLLVSCVAYEAMGLFMPPQYQPELVVILAMTYAFVTRAVLVPSTARRTVIMTALAGVPLVAVAFVNYSIRLEPDHVPEFGRTAFTVWGTASSVVWWALTVVVCALASQVIYGLRRRVRSMEKLGQYLLEKKLGEGGMGVVYRARHAMLRRPTAVKLLLPERTTTADLLRFEREVRQTARLSHPNIVTVFDYGRTPDGIFYYAMELLDGATLDEVVDVSGPLPPERVVHILAQAASALAEAHAVDLIHRDIKPANIMLCRRGQAHDVAKVVDFGLVKQISGHETMGLSETNTLTGTPLYMAPEAITAPKSVDGRIDIYALGAVGYFMLTGTHVFTGTTVVEVCGHHLHTVPELPSTRLGASVPGDIEQLLLTCLEKDPALRPRDALDLQERLLACECAGGWTRHRGESWWREHGEELASRRNAPSDSEVSRTLAVDVEMRSPQ